MHKPLISIILPTKDNLRTIRRCLESIEGQSYPHFEVIFVDNFSTDSTFIIAQEFESRMQLHAYQVGPERNVQRHAGYEHAKGDILYFVDSDMYLDRNLLSEIADIFQDASIGGCIVPETNVDGGGYWTRVKAFERSLYERDDQIEAARVFRRARYEAVGGYNQSLIS
jgi:glycosyltransferase involved in cell wall biosynthesis